MYETILEVIGYVASTIVLISFFMSSVRALRLVNLVGATIFTLYALLTHTYPTALMNLCIMVVDLYYLVRLSRLGSRYTVLPANPDDTYLKAFLDFHADALHSNCPTPEQALQRADTFWLLCQDMTPVGLILGKAQSSGTLELLLEVIVSSHRSRSAYRLMCSALSKTGIRKLSRVASSPSEEKRLRKLGYCQEDGKYVMVL